MCYCLVNLMNIFLFTINFNFPSLLLVSGLLSLLLWKLEINLKGVHVGLDKQRQMSKREDRDFWRPHAVARPPRRLFVRRRLAFVCQKKKASWRVRGVESLPAVFILFICVFKQKVIVRSVLKQLFRAEAAKKGFSLAWTPAIGDSCTQRLNVSCGKVLASV